MTCWSWQSNWKAPGKLNLFLHVVGRRPDGYHQLQTVFRLVNWADTLHFASRQDKKITLHPSLPDVPDVRNLCVRAALLLQKKTLTDQGVVISLTKRLPIGGGMGGGSSDAATTLLALNHLWQCGLTRMQLLELALQIGADVPFFIFGDNAFAQGIGEQLQRCPLPAAWYLILCPEVQVKTAQIFQHPDLPRQTPTLSAIDWRPGQGRNDLESLVCSIFPEVAGCLKMLKQYAPQARMSGSGGCCFAEFPTQQQADAVAQRLPASIPAILVRGLPYHPLRNLLPLR